jgi:hypothetical protein
MGQYDTSLAVLPAARVGTPMTLNLPIVLQRYFEAQNAHDIEAMVACFAPDAVVRDDGRDISGTEAVRAWKKNTSAKYRISAEPIESRVEDGRTVLVVKVSGNSG